MGFDVHYALRSLRRNPGFTAVALLTLALGIGANTAIFSVFSGVLLRPLPYPAASRLVDIREVVPAPAYARFGPTLPVSAWHFREWRKQNHVLEQAALIGERLYTLTGDGDLVRVPAARVSAGLFPMLGIHPALGRVFSEEEDQPGHDSVAVISARLWKSRFQADPAIVGRKILVNGAPRTVIGVLPAGAKLPGESDLYIPFAIRDSDLSVMGEFDYQCVALLKPGVSIPQAVAGLNVIQSNIVKDLSEKVDLRAAVVPLHEAITGGSRQSLTMLLAASAAVLLIVVVNLANLLLARAASRRRELAIRTAIGAGTFRLVRQLLTESVLLAVLGGVLGVLLARWSLSAIILKAPLDLPGLQAVTLDWRALAFAALITLASGILFGILPAWRVARTLPQPALKSGGRAITESRQGGRVRRVLIAAEVALSAVCLVVGGLLLSSFVRLLQVDKGFQPDRAFSLALSAPAVRYPDVEHSAHFMRTLLERVQALPGVVAAGVSNRAPLSGEGSNIDIAVQGVTLPDSQRPIVDYRCVSPEYFRAMGIPLLAGRVMKESDGPRAVAVISAQAAHRLWPDQNALGKRFRLGALDESSIEVVGIAGDVRTSLQKTPNMTVYVPYWLLARNDFALLVRSAMDPLALASAVRGVVRGLDSQLVVPQVRTLDKIVDAAVAARRFQLELILLFAISALLLAALGVYGVVSQTVTQRTGEIGIRMALGATRAEVGALVGRQGLAPVLAGLAAGLAAALFATRLVAGLLFGVRAVDPLIFAGAALVLLASAALACFIPALRATRVDPLIALRDE
jgi:predicted permease